MKRVKKLTTISISKKNCKALKKLGSAGDTMDFLLAKVLKNLKQIDLKEGNT